MHIPVDPDPFVKCNTMDSLLILPTDRVQFAPMYHVPLMTALEGFARIVTGKLTEWDTFSPLTVYPRMSGLYRTVAFGVGYINRYLWHLASSSE